MLTCIARPKKPDESDPNNATSAAKSQAIKSLTSQVGIVQEATKWKVHTDKELLIFVFLFLIVKLDKGYGVEGFGSLQALRSVHGASGAGTSEEQHRVGRGLRPVPVVVPADREFKLDDHSDVGEGDGGAVEGDIERGGDAELRQRTASGAVGAVRGRERAEGVGGAGGAWRFDYLRVVATWR